MPSERTCFLGIDRSPQALFTGPSGVIISHCINIGLEFPDNGCERSISDADEARLELEEHLRRRCATTSGERVTGNCYLSGDLIRRLYSR